MKRAHAPYIGAQILFRRQYWANMCIDTASTALAVQLLNLHSVPSKARNHSEMSAHTDIDDIEDGATAQSSDAWHLLWHRLKGKSSDLASIPACQRDWQIEQSGRCVIFPFLVYGPLGGGGDDATYIRAKGAVTSFVACVDVPGTNDAALNATMDALHGDFNEVRMSPFIVLLVQLFAHLMIVFENNQACRRNFTFVSSRYLALTNECCEDFVVHETNIACIHETVDDSIPGDLLTGRLSWRGLRLVGEAVKDEAVRWDTVKMAKICSTLELLRRQITMNIAAGDPPFQFCRLGDHWVPLLGQWAATSVPSAATLLISDISETLPSSNPVADVKAVCPYNAHVYFPPNFVIATEASRESFHVHDYVLAASWPYFARVLRAGLSECDSRRLVLPPEVPVLVLRAIIHYAYSLQHTVVFDVADADRFVPREESIPGRFRRCMFRNCNVSYRGIGAGACYCREHLTSASETNKSAAAIALATVLRRRGVFTLFPTESYAIQFPLGLDIGERPAESEEHPFLGNFVGESEECPSLEDLERTIHFVTSDDNVEQFCLEDIVVLQSCSVRDFTNLMSAK